MKKKEKRKYENQERVKEKKPMEGFHVLSGIKK